MSWKEAKCGTCTFGFDTEQKSVIVKANKERVIECRRMPPHTLLFPVNTPKGQGLQAVPNYVKIGEHFPACSEYSEVQKPNDGMQRVDIDKLKNFTLPPDMEARVENKES